MDLTLVAGGDYPNTDREFVAMFPDDRACATDLAQLHWPEGFIYPSCERGSTPWNQSRGRLVGPARRHQTSGTAGTIFDKTRTPLTTWFEAAGHVSTAKNGLSAKTLERTWGTHESRWCTRNVHRCPARWRSMKRWSEASNKVANEAVAAKKAWW